MKNFANSKPKPTILTGIRSNEEPTIANYFGGILPMIDLQKKYSGEYNLNMFVPDLHSFTTPIDHSTLYQNTLKNLRLYVAAGLDLDDESLFLYRQSFIPAHSELTWILDCFTGFGEMRRMTQFKEKSGAQDTISLIKERFKIADKALSDEIYAGSPPERAIAESEITFLNKLITVSESEGKVSVGLFNYPVLMAADILLYHAKWVPVGEDQFQHLEITRDIAIRMNKKFGELFTVPASTAEQTKFINRQQGLRIRSLTDPTKKMSKSSDDFKSKILLSDRPEDAYKKIMSATTDNYANINFDWEKQPGISNLLQMLALLTDRPLEEVIAEWQGKDRYGDFKKVVARAISDFLTDFQQRLEQITEQQLLAKLEVGEQAMNEIAKQTLHKVQVSVGLRQAWNSKSKKFVKFSINSAF